MSGEVADIWRATARLQLRMVKNLCRIIADDPRSAAAIGRCAYWDSSDRAAERKLQRQMSGSPVSTDDAAALATVLGVDASAFYAPIDAPG